MIRFLCEKPEDGFVYDFIYALTQSKALYDWRKDEKITLKYIDRSHPLVSAVANPDRYVPVGDVCFIERFVRQFYPNAEKALRPLNVPEVLFPFAGRKILNVTSAIQVPLNFPEAKKLYRKSCAKIKAPSNGFVQPGTDVAALVGYQVSEVVDILSEWRVIVFRNEILYVSLYSGDPLVFPDPDAICEMVRAFAPEAPVVYTLDVGVNFDQTFVIECHRFFSCGLYGFSDYRLYPKLLSQAWFEMKMMKSEAVKERG